MTRLHGDIMEMSYRIMTPEECTIAYHRCSDEGLMFAFNSQADSPSLFDWMADTVADDVLMLGGWIDGEFAGFLDGRSFGPRSRCMEIGVCAFRPWFKQAARLSRGGFLWCFEHLNCASLIGRVAAPNRHIMRMAPHVGFQTLGKVPGLLWYTRKRCFVDGYLVMATKESVEAACAKAEEE